MQKTETLRRIAEARCSAILRTPHKDAVEPAMQAAVDGGFRIIEFTLTTPGALEQIARFAERDNLVVGAGTVLTVEDAQQAQDAGASFLVSPVTDPEVIGYGASNDLVTIPGAYTPTEMLAAHNAGADLIKLFPGPVDGPNYVRICRGPLPFLKIFPTSGVTLENVADYFAAGVHGVGWVANLFAPDDMEAGRFDVIRDRATRMVEASTP